MRIGGGVLLPRVDRLDPLKRVEAGRLDRVMASASEARMHYAPRPPVATKRDAAWRENSTPAKAGWTDLQIKII